MMPEEAWERFARDLHETTQHGLSRESIDGLVAYHRDVIERASSADLDRLRAVERAARDHLAKVDVIFGVDHQGPTLAALRAALTDRAAEEGRKHNPRCKDRIHNCECWCHFEDEAGDRAAEGRPDLTVILRDAIARHGDPHAYRPDLCRCGHFNCEVRAALGDRAAEGGR